MVAALRAQFAAPSWRTSSWSTRHKTRYRDSQLRDWSDGMGQKLDNLDLPPAGVRYWTAQRKAAVILAIRHEVISIWDACERYDLSAEELAEWERHLAPDTQPGLIYKALVNENTARGKSRKGVRQGLSLSIIAIPAFRDGSKSRASENYETCMRCSRAN